jgi:hypothetical protein
MSTKIYTILSALSINIILARLWNNFDKANFVKTILINIGRGIIGSWVRLWVPRYETWIGLNPYWTNTNPVSPVLIMFSYDYTPPECSPTIEILQAIP